MLFALIFVHVVLFAYALGGDLGVHLAARFAVRSDLPLAERIRFFRMLLLVDLGPATAVALFLPTGLEIAARLGLSTLPQVWLWLIWAAAAAWVVAIWNLHLERARGGRPATGPKPVWARAEAVLRYLMLGAAAAIGVASAAGAGPLVEPWLGLKTVLYALCLVFVSLLRRELDSWMTALETLRGFGGEREGNSLMLRQHRAGRWYARSLWLLLAAAAYLGVAGPG